MSISLFSQIEIETVNRCNGNCAFCPVNSNEPQRPYSKMSSELFRKIIDDLKDINYKGKVCLSSNNEPFLDERMEEFIRYVRQQLPEVFLYLWTNGTILKYETLTSIISYIDKIYIDNYSVDGKMGDNVKDIYDKLYEKERDIVGVYDGIVIPNDTKVAIFDRDINAVLSSRGGQAPNNKGSDKIEKTKCRRPFQNMVIRPDGKVSLCCCDALGVYTMGNVNEDTPSNIWRNSSEFYRVRRSMQKSGRKNLELCEKCDFIW